MEHNSPLWSNFSVAYVDVHKGVTVSATGGDAIHMRSVANSIVIGVHGSVSSTEGKAIHMEGANTIL